MDNSLCLPLFSSLVFCIMFALSSSSVIRALSHEYGVFSFISPSTSYQPVVSLQQQRALLGGFVLSEFVDLMQLPNLLLYRT